MMNIESLIKEEIIGRKCRICGRWIEPITVKIGDRERTVVPACECEVEAYEREKERQKRKELATYLEQFFALSNAERYRNCSLENFEPLLGVASAFEKVKNYVAGLEENLRKGRGLVLYGPVGTGKSHLAAAVYWEAKRKDYSAVFNTVSSLMDRLDKARLDSRESEFDLLELLKVADLLILDDLGVEVKSDRSAKRIYEVIAGRYSTNRATIITTNLDKQEDMVQWLGARVFDRLLETAEFVKFSGESYRWRKR
jgi:DNA replication protein DnaC